MIYSISKRQILYPTQTAGNSSLLSSKLLVHHPVLSRLLFSIIADPASLSGNLSPPFSTRITQQKPKLSTTDKLTHSWLLEDDPVPSIYHIPRIIPPPTTRR
ncbi:hypothetical protein ACMFMG_008579 [Clarireedia jacksonii]